MIEVLGDVGSGKTTLIQAVVHGLGYTGEVTSPTFTLARDYPVRDGLTFHHFDLYRLAGQDIVSEEFEELLHDPTSIVAVEWGAHGAVEMPPDRLRISLAAGDGLEQRLITVTGTGRQSANLVKELTL